MTFGTIPEFDRQDGQCTYSAPDQWKEKREGRKTPGKFPRVQRGSKGTLPPLGEGVGTNKPKRKSNKTDQRGGGNCHYSSGCYQLSCIVKTVCLRTEVSRVKGSECTCTPARPPASFHNSLQIHLG